MLMGIWGSAMSQSDAHFWSFYSWGHSLRHELDPVSIIQSRAVNFCDCDCIGNNAIVCRFRAVRFRIPMFLSVDAFGQAQRMFP